MQLLPIKVDQLTLVQFSCEWVCSNIRKNRLMFYASTTLCGYGCIKKTHHQIL